MKTFDEREKERAAANETVQVATIQRKHREQLRASELGQEIMNFASRKHLIVEVTTGQSKVTLTRETRKLVITVHDDAPGDFTYDLKPEYHGSTGSSGFDIQGFLTSITGSRPHDAMMDAVMDWLQK